MSLGLTNEKGRPEPEAHEPGGTYDTAFQTEGSMDILDSDDDGNEFPAAEGYYFKQFVPWGEDWHGVNGWFGPYKRIEDMPPHVLANLTVNKDQQPLGS